MDTTQAGLFGSRRSGVRRWARLTVASVALAAIGTTTFAATPSAAAPTACASSSALASTESRSESRFVSKLNSLRNSRGLGSLAVNSAVAGPAAAWSTTMASQGWLHHAKDVGPGDGVEPHQDYRTLVANAVPAWQGMAENVGYASVSTWCSSSSLQSAADQAVNQLHTAFVNSPGHYKNMVGDYNQVGIGVHIDSQHLWVTVRFVKGPLPVVASASTTRYIDAVHQLFINRRASTAERTRWTPAVQSGARSTMTHALAASDEWAGVRVADLYKKVLGRTPDANGRRYWVSKIAAGTRLEDVAAGFYASEEYFIRNGRSNRGFVIGLYDDILDRRADSSGLSHWVGLLNSGRINRYTAAASFYASIESREDRVETLYREVLGRNPDRSGGAYWAKQLLHTGDVALASFLASSDEFYRKSV